MDYSWIVNAYLWTIHDRVDSLFVVFLTMLGDRWEVPEQLEGAPRATIGNYKKLLENIGNYRKHIGNYRTNIRNYKENIVFLGFFDNY